LIIASFDCFGLIKQQQFAVMDEKELRFAVVHASSFDAGYEKSHLERRNVQGSGWHSKK
jgi:hypothetical protein